MHLKIHVFLIKARRHVFNEISWILDLSIFLFNFPLLFQASKNTGTFKDRAQLSLARVAKKEEIPKHTQ